MSRRDTIIISVLINAGLLAILFATAWNDDEAIATSPPLPTKEQATIAAHIPPAAPKSAPVASSNDEVDAVLRRYAQTQRQTAKPTKPTPRSDEAQAIEVVVKRGDMLSKIARANNTTVDAIMKANNLSSPSLEIGQKLRIPTNTVREEKAVAALTPDAGPEYYIVQPGDNPWTIARKHKVPLKELLDLNDLDDQKARRLKAGDKLRVR